MERTNTNEAKSLLLTAEELAGLLRCSLRHVHRLRKKGLLPTPLSVGGILRFPRHKVEAWLDGVPLDVVNAMTAPNVTDGA